MISINRGRGWLLQVAIASGVGAWASSISLGLAGDVVPAGIMPGSKAPKPSKHHPTATLSGAGTLGYGPPGYHPGFQGFGLGYHPGYGYGGQALGPGAFGGYPFYGGPGYPHPWPTLNRCGPITPFCYFGGPGYPTPEHPHFFGEVGPLSPDQPVVTFQDDPYNPPYAAGYGNFDGTIPYPESTFAPYTTMAGSGGSASGVSTVTPSTAPPIPSTAIGRTLGFDVEPFENRVLGSGLKINIVVPGGLAEKAGLHVNDVIQSINGYSTQKLSDLAWVLENAAASKTLTMKVRTVNNDNNREFTIPLP